jgi:type III secretory pathway component EscU
MRIKFPRSLNSSSPSSDSRSSHAQEEKLVAASIRYRQAEGGAPVVSETGDQETAALMLRIAKKYQIPVVTDRELARELSTVGRKRPIPPRLYTPVAKLLVACKTKSGS